GLKGLIQFVAANLSSFHRAEVEQFRIAQLELVRAVSAQIANVLDLDELARRVTDLIQRTFNYYYVAIFTLEIESNALAFRSSASASRKGRKKPAIKLEVEVGQGLIGEAALTGQRILSNDVRSETRFRFIDSLPETRSEIAIPLKVEHRILGVMDVQSNRRQAFHPIDILVLNSLADSIARAVESARHYSGMVRRADQLAFLSEVSKIVASSLDLPVILEQSAKLIEDKFGYSHIALYTVHPNRRLIQYEAGSGPANRVPRGYSISLDRDTGIIGRTARQGRTNLVHDIGEYGPYALSPLLSRDLHSGMCVPLVFEGVVLGLLDLQSEHPNAFHQDDQRMFEAAAGTMAAAIRNADLFRSEQWRRQVSDSLREVAGLVSANVGVENVLETILAELDRNLPIEVSAVWLLDEGEISLAAVHGCEAEELEGLCLTEPESVVSMMMALRTGTALIRPPNSPQWPVELVAGFDSDSSSIAAPLRIGDRPLGILTITHHSAGRYGHEALAITTTFASNAAVAIENARLYDSAQEQAYASAALLQVAQAVASSSDLNEVLGTIIRIMPILVGVRRAILYRWEEAKQVFLATHQYGLNEDEQQVITERELAESDFPALAYTHERNRMVNFPLQADRPVHAWLEIRPTLDASINPVDPDRILMSVPLSIKNDFYGILLVEEADRARRFRPRRIEILNGIAQQAALAIQNDLLQQEMVVRERLETEVQLARQIQQTFIPQVLPSHPFWQLAACWRTARQVGGDFYDVIELPAGRLGIFIADVADKGIPAALFMALTRTLVRG
ncbi:MAG: GAF domain-containing protein, partial [Chloroflexi bacterium]|nr:GAF domain-containing protein [Chloroflexota bacterium]